MLISTVIALVLSSTGLVQHMFRFPETLGLVMAAQLLIGRYTGYRLMELFRFRDFLKPTTAVGRITPGPSTANCKILVSHGSRLRKDGRIQKQNLSHIRRFV